MNQFGICGDPLLQEQFTQKFKGIKGMKHTSKVIRNTLERNIIYFLPKKSCRPIHS